MPEIVLFKPRPHQLTVYNKLRRFNVLVCHRRFGKTVLCINVLVRRALECTLKEPRYAYIAPLYKQAKQVAWDYLKEYTEQVPGRVVRESDLRVDLPNGARIQLFGADNPDALRGMYLDGVVLDEYAQMRPNLWSAVLRPLLTDRKGWGIFIGTPQGHNEFYKRYLFSKKDGEWYGDVFKASETGIIDEDELVSAQNEMQDEEYLQEFECSFEAAIRGAYYGKLMAKATDNGRIGGVSYDPAVPVHTCWDLGIGDATAIWFFQMVGTEYHWIDYYENTGEGLQHYVAHLHSKEYIYGDHYFPHDAEARELGTGKSRVEVLQELGIAPIVVPRQSVEDGINAVRNIIPKSWFDEEKCRDGIEALKQYRSDYDDVKGMSKRRPLHDWTSHGADSMRTGCMGARPSINWEPLDLGVLGLV